MAIQGLRDTADYTADQRPKNWREGILLHMPNGNAPLYALTSRMKKKPTDDPEFSWFTKEFQQRRLALTAAINATPGALTITVGGGGASALKKDNILLVEESGELLRVTADPTTDTSVVTLRGIAGTTETAVDPAVAGTNPHVLVIGSAHEEGSLPPTSISHNPVKFYNYTQIFRDTLALTRTAKKTRLRTGDQVKESKRECLEQHSVDIERALWFGKPSEDLTGAEPRRTTGGVLHWIGTAGPDYTHDYTGSTTSFADLEADMERIFRYGSSEKMAFCGNMFALVLQRIVRKNSVWQFMGSEKEFGMNVMRLVTPFGSIVFKTHPLFTLLTGGSVGGTPYYGMTSAAVVLDMADLVYRPLDDTKYEADIQQNGLDGMQSGFLTEMGLELHHPTNHFVWLGLNTAAADA